MTATSSLQLRDGRSLDLFDTGAGPVVVYHHGTPSSGSVPPALLAAATDLGARVVSWSRPGYAGSTRQPGRLVADVAADAREVLDALGIARAASIGWSGGGPHALACGALAPDRFPAVGLLAGVAPYVESRGSLAWLEGMGEENLVEFGAAFEGEHAAAAVHLVEGAGHLSLVADHASEVLAVCLERAGVGG
jgi:pimeloyl-ACP methyl ester carboxylesterase